MAKTTRQLATSPMTPPTIGPTAGATPRVRPPTPMSAPNLVRGAWVRMIVNMSGVMMPVPTP